MQAQQIEQMIQAGLPDARVQVLGNDGQHFEATVVCESFAGQSRLQRHRLVYAGLAEAINSGALHAVSIRALTPDEWTAQQPLQP